MRPPAIAADDRAIIAHHNRRRVPLKQTTSSNHLIGLTNNVRPSMEQQENLHHHQQQESFFGVGLEWQKFVNRQLGLIRQLQQRLERRDVENAELKQRLELLERRLERSERRRGLAYSCTKELNELGPLLHPKKSHSNKKAKADKLLTAAKTQRRPPKPRTAKKSTSDDDTKIVRRARSIRQRTDCAVGKHIRDRSQKRPVRTSESSSESPSKRAKPPVETSSKIQPGVEPPKATPQKKLLIDSSELLLSRLDDVPPPPQLATPAPAVAAKQRRLSGRILEKKAPLLAGKSQPEVNPEQFYKVPGFRVCNLEPIRTGRGGEEDMSDAAFEKRHLKHEKHERMIVRRDKQRQRELLLRQALEANSRSTSLLRQTGAAQQQQHSSTTPADESVRRLDDLQTIQVVQRLPKDVFVVEHTEV